MPATAAPRWGPVRPVWGRVLPPFAWANTPLPVDRISCGHRPTWAVCPAPSRASASAHRPLPTALAAAARVPCRRRDAGGTAGRAPPPPPSHFPNCRMHAVAMAQWLLLSNWTEKATLRSSSGTDPGQHKPPRVPISAQATKTAQLYPVPLSCRHPFHRVVFNLTAQYSLYWVLSGWILSRP